MKFWNDFESFKGISKTLKLECHLNLNFDELRKQTKTKNGSYADFIKSMPFINFGVMTDFEKKFIYTNQYVGSIKEDGVFKDFISHLPDLIENNDYDYCSMLIYLFSITKKRVLKNNFIEFERKVYEIIDCNNFKNINSLYSLVFSYLFFVFYVNQSFNFGLFSMYLKQYLYVSRDVWSSFSISSKSNYALVTYLINIFLKSQNFENYLFEISKIYDEVASEYERIGDKVYYSIFVDLSNQIKEDLFENFFSKSNLYKLLTENDHHKIKNIFYKINSYRKPISIETLYDFLYQFEKIDRIRAVLKILDNLNFFTFNRLNEIIENILILQLASTANKIYVCPLEADGSSSIYQYLVSHSENVKKKYGKRIKFERSIKDVLDNSEVDDEIVVIDDCSLSGTQTSNIILELIGKRELKAHHDIHCDKLDEELLEKFKSSKVNLCFCVGSDYAKIKLEKLFNDNGLNFFKVYVGKYLHMTEPSDKNPGNRVFGSNSLIWDNSKERDDLREFCQKIGYQILDEIAENKGWDEKRRIQSSLGYSDLQQVIIFPYSVPKTTLPILWCEHESWKPLFQNT